MNVTIIINGNDASSSCIDYDFRNAEVGARTAVVSGSQAVKHTDDDMKAILIGARFKAITYLGITFVTKTVFLDPISPRITVEFCTESGNSSECKDGLGQKTVTYKSFYGTLPTPSRAGYAFAGWFTEEGQQVYSTSVVNTLSSHRLYPRWRPRVYVVSFNANGGDNAFPSVQITHGSTYGNLPSPTRLGYKFGGWSTSLKKGAVVNSDDVFDCAEDQVLHAIWDPQNYIVYFKVDNENYINYFKSVQYNNMYGNLYIPSMIGYKFDGWYTACSSGVEVTEITSYTETKDSTLCAHWKPKTCTVSFNPNRGYASFFTTTVTYDSTYTNFPTTVTRTGYEFDGWYTEVSGGTIIDSNTKVTTAASHTLYAHWTAKEFTVTFDGNGITLSETPITVTYDSTYGKLPTPTREGYDFNGWYTEASGGDKIDSSTKVTTTTSQTLYAQWIKSSKRSVEHLEFSKSIELSSVPEKRVSERSSEGEVYTLCFNGNGVTLSETPITVTYNSIYGTLPTPTREGYKFDGWYTEVSGGTIIDSNTKVTTAASHTLYAHWIANEFTVTLNGNGGTPSETPITVTYDSTYGTLPTPTREGYKFDGWYTLLTRGDIVSARKYVTITASQVLYAHWTKMDYNMMFDFGNGTVTNERLSFNKAIPYPSIPEKTGHKFLGWKDVDAQGAAAAAASSSSSSSYPFFQETLVPSRDVYLRADFAALTYTVLLQFDEVTLTVTEPYGTAIPLPDPFEPKEGYTFSGWADEGGAVWADVFVVTRDAVLSVKWNSATYVAVFVTGDASNVTLFIAHGSPIDPPELARPGFYVERWCRGSPDCTDSYNEELMPPHDEVFYAVWSEVPRFVEVSLGPCNESGVGGEDEDGNNDTAWVFHADGVVGTVSVVCTDNEAVAIIEFSSPQAAEEFYKLYKGVHEIRYVKVNANRAVNTLPLSLTTLLLAAYVLAVIIMG